MCSATSFCCCLPLVFLLRISRKSKKIKLNYEFKEKIAIIRRNVMHAACNQQLQHFGVFFVAKYLLVVRGGQRVQIHISDIVVGDIIPLKPGDYIPADGLLGVGQSLQIDKSDVSVEPHLLTIDQNCPFLRCGSTIVAGYGLMLVTAAGIRLEKGVSGGTWRIYLPLDS